MEKLKVVCLDEGKLKGLVGKRRATEREERKRFKLNLKRVRCGCATFRGKTEASNPKVD